MEQIVGLRTLQRYMCTGAMRDDDDDDDDDD